MSLINCKVQLNLKWKKYCILASNCIENADASSDNIIFTIKDINLFFLVVNLSVKYNRKLSKLLIKWFQRSVYSTECKTKNEIKSTTNKYKNFLESNFVGVNRLFALIYSGQSNNSEKSKIKRYYLPKGTINN